MEGTRDEINLQCIWYFTDKAQTMVRLEEAGMAIAPCMPKGLTSSPGYESDQLNRLGKHEASIETDSHEVTLTLEATEFFYDDRPSSYWVSLEVESYQH